MRRASIIVAALVLANATNAAADPCLSADSTVDIGAEKGAYTTSTTPEAPVPALATEQVKADLDKLKPKASLEKVAAALDGAAKRLAAKAKTEAKPADAEREDAAVALIVARAARLRAIAKAEETLTVTAATEVEIRLANPPTTRLRLSLDRTAGGHKELEWDPAVSTTLLQHVHLDVGDWKISASVDPIIVQQGDGSMIVATTFQPLVANGGAFISVGTQAALVANTSFQDSAKQIAMTGWPAPTLAFRCDAERPEIASMTFASHLSTRAAATQRSATAPDIVTQTLSILAEIAVGRAKSGAMDIVKQRFVDPLCSDAQHVSLAMLHLSTSNDLAFPRTCKILEALRLEDVLSGGDGLLRALRDDVRFTIGPVVIKQMTAHEPLLQRLLLAVYDVVNREIDSGSFNGFEAQLLVDAAGFVEDAMPPFALPISGLRVVLTSGAAPKLVAAICGKTPLADCIPNLASTKRSVQGWLEWFANLRKATDIATIEAVIAAYLDRPKLADVRRVLCTVAGVVQPTRACVQRLAAGFPPEPSLASILDYIKGNTQILEVLRARVADSKSVLGTIVPIACQARLAVAIIKKCSGESCTSSTITDMLTKPESYFAPEGTLPLSLCWTASRQYVAAPAALTSIERIVIDGLELVDPSQLTNSQDRAVAAINFALEVIQRIRGSQDDRISSVGEIAVALVRGHWDSALMSTVRLLDQLAKDQGFRSLPPGIEKLAQLAGAVASYTAVYNSTKNDDPKAAREARKQALESLIDAATNRKGREGNWVVSFGSNVGASWTFANQYDFRDPLVSRLGLRVPLGLSIQHLPGKSHIGFHAALNAIDLGQFIRATNDDVRWDSFVAPGIEIGGTLGDPSHMLTLVAHGAFVPGVGDPMAPTKARWEFGVALGYYVPFFDLN